MTAYDGRSFNIFVTSSDLRKSLTTLGISIPKTVNGIKQQVMRYANNLRQRVARSLQTSKSKNEKFSISFEEWTSLYNKDKLISISIAKNTFGILDWSG